MQHLKIRLKIRERALLISSSSCILPIILRWLRRARSRFSHLHSHTYELAHTTYVLHISLTLARAFAYPSHSHGHIATNINSHAHVCVDEHPPGAAVCAHSHFMCMRRNNQPHHCFLSLAVWHQTLLRWQQSIRQPWLQRFPLLWASNKYGN